MFMKRLFLDCSMNFISKYQSISDYDKKRIKYGLEGLYLTISKMVILIILAIILDMLRELILVIICFNVSYIYNYLIFLYVSFVQFAFYIICFLHQRIQKKDLFQIKERESFVRLLPL